MNFAEIYSRVNNVIKGIIYVNSKEVEIIFNFDSFLFATSQKGYIKEFNPDDSDIAVSRFKDVLLRKIGL